MRRAFRCAGATFAGSLLLGLLAACSLAPDYHRPDTPTPDVFKEADDWAAAHPTDGLPRGPWWRIFGEARLDALEDEAAGANQDIKAAVARLDQARAAADYARGFFFPTVSANASSLRAGKSRTTAVRFPPFTYSDHLLAADLSYEVDVFGRVRNAVAQAEAQAQASAGDLAALDLSLHAELATDYFTLRGYDAQQIVLDAAVAAYEKALRVTLDRYHGAIAAELDVDEAQAQLETARTQATDTRLKRAQMEHAIAILIGRPPSQFSLPPLPLDANPPEISPGLPSTLLERRPDVAAAERRIAAANANIGIARAAYFPVFDLNGLLGYESALPGAWITAPSRVWSLGPSAVITIIDGGQIRALNDSARAAYDENVAGYRQTVLDAFRDVEDSLAAIRLLDQESRTQNAAAAAARRALGQAQTQYIGGLINYLEVVIAENAALSAQLSAVDIMTRRMTSSVLLIKAIGGGWQADSAMEAEAASSTEGSMVH